MVKACGSVVLGSILAVWWVSKAFGEQGEPQAHRGYATLGPNPSSTLHALTGLASEATPAAKLSGDFCGPSTTLRALTGLASEGTPAA